MNLVPATKRADDQVFSSTMVDNGYIEIIAEKVGDDTTFAKIIELVEEAQESKTKTEKFLDKFSSIYTTNNRYLVYIGLCDHKGSKIGDHLSSNCMSGCLSYRCTSFKCRWDRKWRKEWCPCERRGNHRYLLQSGYDYF